jgi:hypothetical protein
LEEAEVILREKTEVEGLQFIEIKEKLEAMKRKKENKIQNG